jgi:hypothetical protein
MLFWPCNASVYRPIHHVSRGNIPCSYAPKKARGTIDSAVLAADTHQHSPNICGDGAIAPIAALALRLGQDFHFVVLGACWELKAPICDKRQVIARVI